MTVTENWNHRKEIAKKRLNICQNCSEYIFQTTQCKQCGCFMLAKAMFAFSECPLNKWSIDKNDIKAQ